jgi:sulfite reductase (ferredoxin)
MSTKSANQRAAEATGYQPASRMLGVHAQKQDGFFMQRIKVLGGRIKWRQWRKIAELAQSYSASSSLHITTRQDIELHNIRAEDLSAVQHGLSEAALPTCGAGGDSVRNITVCSGCELCPDSFGLMPLARLVQQHLKRQPAILDLPRKFKISFSGCRRACAKPWINCLGFVAQHDGKFTVIGAGSLGPKPSLGIEFCRDLQAKDVLPFSAAAIEFFGEFGDRQDRRRARFRHVRERLGDHALRSELDARFNKLKAQQPWPNVSLPSGNSKMKLLGRLQLPNGNIQPRQAVGLADAAESQGAEVRINLEHGLELYGPQYIELPESLADFEGKPVMLACPGKTSCPKGLVNTQITAQRLRRRLCGAHCTEVRISISGCRNNCAHSIVADIGLAGLLRQQQGKRTECYQVFTGGGNGKKDRLARPVGIISVDEVTEVIATLMANQFARNADGARKCVGQLSTDNVTTD